jgi:hypothetical protein
MASGVVVWFVDIDLSFSPRFCEVDAATIFTRSRFNDFRLKPLKWLMSRGTSRDTSLKRGVNERSIRA